MTVADTRNSKWRPPKSFSFQKLFLLSVLVAVILNFRCRPISGHVGSVIYELGMAESVGVAASTASKSISVQKLFLLPVLMAAILNFGCRPVSDHVLSATSESGVVDNVGVAVETASPSFSSKVIFACLYFPHVDFRVLSRHFGTSGQSKREAMTSSCRAFIQAIGL